MKLLKNKKVSFYQAWHTPKQSRQITLSGTVSPSAKADPIDIALPPNEGPYHSDWQKHIFTPTKAVVSQLTHHYSGPTGHCLVERVTYEKQDDGTWVVSKKPIYIARNSHAFTESELASAEK